MEREEIVRSDFPTVRKGWSPEAVEAHLNAVADWVAATASKARSKATPAADAASERIGAILVAAESSAAEIVEEAEAEADRIVAAAHAEADQIRAAARTESEETVSAASREASGRIEQAQAAVEGLVAQADKLRSQVGALGRDLAASVPGFGPANAGEPELPVMPDEPEGLDEPEEPEGPEEVAEQSAEADEPEVEAEPADAPRPEGGSGDGPASEQPSAEPAPKRRLRRRAPKPKAAKPEAAKSKPVQAKAAGPSDEELIAQLRAGDSDRAADEPAPAPAISGSEHGAVRLVAMNMALDGASREQIAKQIEAEFGTVDEVDALLDDVLRRASR
ncbi:MAG: hypothetical protein KDB46_05275 [Solirubrobacterales bacterium]|nr:hypothetical protein [Solirubrobacterales bacterium]